MQAPDISGPILYKHRIYSSSYAMLGLFGVALWMFFTVYFGVLHNFAPSAAPQSPTVEFFASFGIGSIFGVPGIIALMAPGTPFFTTVTVTPQGVFVHKWPWSKNRAGAYLPADDIAEMRVLVEEDLKSGEMGKMRVALLPSSVDKAAPLSTTLITTKSGAAPRLYVTPREPEAFIEAVRSIAHPTPPTPAVPSLEERTATSRSSFWKLIPGLVVLLLIYAVLALFLHVSASLLWGLSLGIAVLCRFIVYVCNAAFKAKSSSS